MTSATQASSDHLDRHVDQAKRRIKPWVVPMARLGFATKGLVYIAVAILAIRAASGAGADEPSKHSVFAIVGAQPFGRVLLVVMATGLIAYALWRFIEAIFNPEYEPRTAKGYGKRLAWLGSGLLYGGIGVGIAMMAIGLRSGNPDAVKDWTRWGMAQPFGKTLVAGVGLCVLIRGAQQIWRSMRRDLAGKLQLYRMDHQPHRWAVRIARFGLGARGVVFLIIGVFLILAAWNANPNEARGLGQALLTLERAPYGPWVLLIVGTGLLAYGVFNLIEARYRSITPP